MRAHGAIPMEKSIRGSARGVTSNVASQFTIVTASWLGRHAGNSMTTSVRTSQLTPAAFAFATSGRSEDTRDHRD